MTELERHAFHFKPEESLERESSLDPGGAGSPSGETAPRPGFVDQLPRGIRDRLPDELVDELLAGARTEEEIAGPGGLLAQLTKRLIERAMAVELTDHLGYEHGDAPLDGTGNTRNGTTPKTAIRAAPMPRGDGERDERSRPRGRPG